MLDPGEVEATAYVCDVLHPACFALHHTFTDGRRNVSYNDGGGSRFCDRESRDLEWEGPGWYRFTGKAGTRMPETPPPTYSCGTQAPGWLNGTHPATNEGVVSREICFHWFDDTCRYKTTTFVVNCGNFYLYSLPEAPACWLTYCGAD